MAGEGNGVKFVPEGNKGAATNSQQAGSGSISAGALKGMNRTAELLIINMGDITKKMRDRKERKNGFVLLKAAFEKVLGADGAAFASARCEFDEKNLVLAVIVEEKEFAKISADFKSVYISQDGVKKDVGNFELPLAREFGALLNSLAEKNGVAVQIA